MSERALQSLSVTARAVVWLYEVEGYTHEEIARLFRAHRQFFQVTARARFTRSCASGSSPVRTDSYAHRSRATAKSCSARAAGSSPQDMVRDLLDPRHLERQKTARRLRQPAAGVGATLRLGRVPGNARGSTRLSWLDGGRITERTWLPPQRSFLVVLGLAAWIRLTRSDLKPAVATLTPLETNPPILESHADSDYVDRRADAAERWLVNLPREPGVVRVGTRAVVSGLEDRIAQLDDYLSAARVEGVQPAALAGAEQQRALLVKSLAQVRYAQMLVAQAR